MSVNYRIYCKSKLHQTAFYYTGVDSVMLEHVALRVEHVSEDYSIHYSRSIPRLIGIEDSGDGHAFSTEESRALAFYKIGAAINSVGAEIVQRQQEHIKRGDTFAAHLDDDFSYDSIHHLNLMMEMLQTMQRLIVHYPEYEFELVWY